MAAIINTRRPRRRWASFFDFLRLRSSRSETLIGSDIFLSLGLMSASVACLSSRTMLAIAAPAPRYAAAPSPAATRVPVGSGSSFSGVSTSRAGGEISTRFNRCRCPCGGGVLLRGTRSWLVDSSAAAELAPTLKRRTTSMALVESDMSSEEEVGRSRPFLRARSEEELLSCLWKEVESRRFSSDIAARLEELYYNYRDAVMQSGNTNSREIILSNMAVLFDRILLDSEDPFRFPPYHKAIREPFDYYMFGQNYLRPLINFRTSYVGNISLFFEIEEKIQQGHNVVLFSNHQTEPDPALIALLLERTNSHISEAMVFVAGDRVITDPLCKPFSMGRNLLCVYSKKHMNDIPELVEMKRRANTRSLKEMALLLRGGSQLIWIAPSGGRDRPDPLTGEWHPAPFDSSSVDNMRRLVEHSGAPWHIYPLSLLCYEVMPPPPDVEKQIGEKREIAFHGIGLSLAPEMNFHEITAGCANPEEAKDVFSQALYDSVTEQYNVLKAAIYDHQGLNASNYVVSLSQPWL